MCMHPSFRYLCNQRLLRRFIQEILYIYPSIFPISAYFQFLFSLLFSPRNKAWKNNSDSLLFLILSLFNYYSLIEFGNLIREEEKKERSSCFYVANAMWSCNAIKMEISSSVFGRGIRTHCEYAYQRLEISTVG